MTLMFCPLTGRRFVREPGEGPRCPDADCYVRKDWDLKTGLLTLDGMAELKLLDLVGGVHA